ncbi:MAG: hypothetical protein AAF652_20345 [Cyanobacteria bacterium P01_C01_bin.72]
MKEWYTTREAEGLTHRSQKVAKDKLLYLTPQQTKLINAKTEKVAKTTAPTKPDDVAVLADWNEYKRTSAVLGVSPISDSSKTNPPQPKQKTISRQSVKQNVKPDSKLRSNVLLR